MMAEKGDLLVVDDTLDNLRLLSAMLSKQGYRVRKAINGTIALNTIQQMPPDLVLLDINMPDLNGYEVCQILKTDPLTQEIPIIFISALDDVLDKVKAFQVGGSDYITKPFQSEELLARIQHQLTIQQQKRQLQIEIQERKKTEQALQVYLHVVSHDLRNPVLGMSLILKNVLKAEDTPTDPILLARAIVERMAQSCDRQLDLINSLVETQQFETGKVVLNLQNLSLASLIQQFAAEWQPILTQHQAILTLAVPPDLPLVQADNNLLWRVLENLLANALKYNAANLAITLKAEQQADRVYCALQDNGIGIAPEQADRLFDRYQRGTHPHRTLGLGLGLYLCRQIIEAHGGTIGAIALEPGVEFWFTLPVGMTN
ncbi:MAG: response regulator [Snowella sp.]|nr:response regulator [Snowella sp.]